MSGEQALPVYAYSVDGQGLPAYPAPLTADDTILHLFYEDQPVLYPATFFINVHSKRFVPLTRGALDVTALRQTLTCRSFSLANSLPENVYKRQHKR